ncbi:MAG: outer membrane beta-barrel protein [Alphaproteobacteria bacterium]|nr:outer membrane beta-barrel protein [Alphaproteobacteria bacterium]
MRYGPVRLIAGVALVAAAIGGAATGAAAQTVFRPTPSPWDGLYLGVHAGYGWGKNDVLEDPANSSPYVGTGGNSWGYDTEGMLGGVHGGLNWESNRLILGLEAGLGYMAVEGDGPDPGSPGLDTIAAQGAGYYADVSARIGFAPDNMLYYMKAGVVFADLDWSVEDACTTGGCSTPDTINAANDDIRSGWTAGVGVAYAVSQNASLRLEYAYYDLGTIRMTGAFGGTSYRWEQEVMLHTVTAGVSFMF